MNSFLSNVGKICVLLLLVRIVVSVGRIFPENIQNSFISYIAFVSAVRIRFLNYTNFVFFSGKFSGFIV